MKSFLLLLTVLSLTFGSARAAGVPKKPRIVGDCWQVAGDPDLGKLTDPKQQPVDFGLWQAADGTWQLWSCIRHTKERGHTRLFYRWEGARLTEPNWQLKGIALRADPKTGELEGGLQAPFVFHTGTNYVMCYSVVKFPHLARHVVDLAGLAQLL